MTNLSLQAARATVRPGGANVYNIPTRIPTGEIIAGGTEVVLGLNYEGPFNEDAEPGEDFGRYICCAVAESGGKREVWLNANDLFTPTAPSQ